MMMMMMMVMTLDCSGTRQILDVVSIAEQVVARRDRRVLRR